MSRTSQVERVKSNKSKRVKIVCLIIFHYISGDVFDLPVPKYAFQMISSPDKKTLYVIGGTDHSGNLRKEIYKSQCSGAINTCKWTKSKTELKFGRESFVAISIPNSLADKLCE